MIERAPPVAERPIERVIDALWDGVPPGAALYAVFDGARDARIVPSVARSGLEQRCLYDGRLPRELVEAAPHLLRLDRAAPATSALLRDGWGRSWGIFLASTTPLDPLRRHLRRFLRVRDEDGRRLLFRYYDPRVLRVFLPTCTPDELAQLFGPIDRFLVEADAASLLIFRFAGALETTRRALEAAC